MSDESDFVMSDGGSDFAPEPAPKKKAAPAARGRPRKQPLAPARANESETTPPSADASLDLTEIPSAAPAARSATAKNKTATETYQKLTQLEHVLLRPDTYIGSIEMQTDELWVFDKTSKQMVFRKVGYVPGFYKIFDEILVNAADNKVGRLLPLFPIDRD